MGSESSKENITEESKSLWSKESNDRSREGSRNMDSEPFHDNTSEESKTMDVSRTHDSDTKEGSRNMDSEPSSDNIRHLFHRGLRDMDSESSSDRIRYFLPKGAREIGHWKKCSPWHFSGYNKGQSTRVIHLKSDCCRKVRRSISLLDVLHDNIKVINFVYGISENISQS
jgi:hypothetical protein